MSNTDKLQNYIFRYTSRSRTENNYWKSIITKDYIGISTEVPFVPIYTLEAHHHNWLKIKKNKDDDHVTLIYEYGIDKIMPNFKLSGEIHPDYVYYNTEYDDTLNALKGAIYSSLEYVYHLLVSLGERSLVRVQKGILIDENEDLILICLAISTSYISNPDNFKTIRSIFNAENISERAEAVNSIPPEDLSIYISHRFVEDRKYRNFRKRIEEGYIKPLRNLGVSLTYVENIEERLFRNPLKEKPISSLEDLREYLEEIPNIVLEEYIEESEELEES